jgi:hypothetical protein
MGWFWIDSVLLQIVVDHRSQHRGRRYAEELLARDFPRMDCFLRGQPTIVRQDNGQRFRGNTFGSQSISWPVRKPMAKVGLLGRAARRFAGCVDLNQRMPRMIQKGSSRSREFNAAGGGLTRCILSLLL